jgi:uncharacterized membrane protein YkoI
MKNIAMAAAIATALTLGMATAGAAQSSTAHTPAATQPAMHATTTQTHTTAATHTAATHHPGTHISESRARRAARAEVAHGLVKAHRLTHVNGKLVYVYTLAVPGQSGTQKVTVDATTGAVISNEHMAAAGATHTHRASTQTHTAAHHKR